MKSLRLAVIGKPVNHSLSPKIHASFGRLMNIPLSYEAVEVAPEELLDFTARAYFEYDGYNVTTPHKEAVYKLVDNIGKSAYECKAVNTVIVSDEQLTGFSTDGEGVIRSLSGKIEISGAKVLLLGVGGAAKSISRALSGAGASVTALTRREGAQPLFGAELANWSDLEALSTDAQVIINATPLGMEGREEFDGFSFLDKTRAAVFDIVYHPVNTRLLTEAAMRGLYTINGLNLLLWQAAAAFELFTGTAVPPAAAEEVLREITTPRH